MNLGKITLEQAKHIDNLFKEIYQKPPTKSMRIYRSLVVSKNMRAIKGALQIAGAIDWEETFSHSIAEMKGKVYSIIYTHKDRKLVDDYFLRLEYGIGNRLFLKMAPNGFAREGDIMTAYIGVDESEQLLNEIYVELNAHIRNLILGETND